MFPRFPSSARKNRMKYIKYTAREISFDWKVTTWRESLWLLFGVDSPFRERSLCTMISMGLPSCTSWLHYTIPRSCVSHFNETIEHFSGGALRRRKTWKYALRPESTCINFESYSCYASTVNFSQPELLISLPNVSKQLRNENNENTNWIIRYCIKQSITFSSFVGD